MGSAIIVVRLRDEDVASVRKAINGATPDSQHVVFRQNPSPGNLGIDCYGYLTNQLDELFRRAKRLRKKD